MHQLVLAYGNLEQSTTRTETATSAPHIPKQPLYLKVPEV